MRHHRLRTPSPALVISLIALFVALGGTSYAAIHLPKNSVGTTQLKNGAVTKKKISRKTITALKGNRGLQGPQGAPGVKGDTGPRGPSDAYDAASPFSGMNVPAGSYVISAKVGTTGGTGQVSLDCHLDALINGSFTALDHANASATTATGTTDLVVPMQAVATFAAPTELALGCAASAAGGGSPSFSDPRLTAIQFATVH